MLGAVAERRFILTPFDDPPRVFIVEDDEAVRDSLAAVFTAIDLMAVTFATGGAFLDVVRPDHRGCLILDLHLPVVDGFDVLAGLAARRIGLPVIAVSGQLNCNCENRLRNAGVSAIFRKPLDIDHLIETTQKLLTGKGRET